MKPISPPRVIWALLLVTTISLSAGCRSLDPTRFDERLRQATFDELVSVIELRHGGLVRLEIQPGDLASRYRDPALRATDATTFYRTLARMLNEIQDPHVSLRVSSTVDRKDWAQPDRCLFLRVEGRLFAGISTLARTGEAVRSLVEHRDLSFAGRLQASADSSPTVWYPVQRIDGMPVSSAHQAQLLIRGKILTPARIQIVGEDGENEEVQVIRNAITFRLKNTQIVMGPREAGKLLSQGQEGDKPSKKPTGPIGRSIDDQQSRDDRFSSPVLFSRGSCLSPSPTGKELWEPEIEAWLFDDVGYLRLGSFQLPYGNQEMDDAFRLYQKELHLVMEGLSKARHLVLDLQGNRGGEWNPAGLVLSYFLPERDPIPFTVLKKEKWLLGLLTVENSVALSRTPVQRRFFDDLVVLIDQWTASGAEVVASALRGRCAASLVGERTAGAEYAVLSLDLPDGTTVILGQDGGMTQGCESFQGSGLLPDKRVIRKATPLSRRGYRDALEDHRRETIRQGLRMSGLDPSNWMRF